MTFPDKEKHRNPDGTYNGASYFSALTGLSEAEIKWTWDRARQLAALGLDKETRAKILKHEVQSKPWEKSTNDHSSR